MDFTHHLLVALLLTVQFYDLCTGSVTLSVHIKRFQNPNGADWAGRTCDRGIGGWFGKYKCDHRFTFCLDRLGGGTDPNHCHFRRLNTGEVGAYNNNHDIVFREGNGGARFMTLQLQSWPHGVIFKTEVHDDDDHTSHDLVDRFYHVISSSPDRGHVIIPKQHSVTLTGQRQNSPTRLYIEYKLYCRADYYADTCTVYCVDRDDDHNGHYTCDQNDGHKICLPGWEGESCTVRKDNCKVHACENNSTCVDGYDSYTCLCMPGYEGTMCEENIDVCLTVTCQNNGTCVDGEHSDYHCACVSPYAGVHCERDLCEELACENGGLCATAANDTLVCECATPYSGVRCELTKTTTTTEASTVTTTTMTTTTEAPTVTTTTKTPSMSPTTTTEAMVTVSMNAMGANGYMHSVQSSNTALPTWTILVIALVVILIAAIAAVCTMLMVRRVRSNQKPETPTDGQFSDPNGIATFANPVYAVAPPQLVIPPSSSSNTVVQVSPVELPPYLTVTSSKTTPSVAFTRGGSGEGNAPTRYDYPPPPVPTVEAAVEVDPIYEPPPWQGTESSCMTALEAEAPPLPPKLLHVDESSS